MLAPGIVAAKPMPMKPKFNFLFPFLFLALSALLVPHAMAVSPDIVISQVYGGAGCGTAGCSTYQNDFIELFNRGSSPVSVNGWSVQYAAAGGTSWATTILSGTNTHTGQTTIAGGSVQIYSNRGVGTTVAGTLAAAS